jgi:tetratricopeptide (TPR) repeat protein
MRAFVFAGFVLAALIGLPVPHVGAQDKPADPVGAKKTEQSAPAKPPAPPKSREERLNDLFARLAKAKDPAEANGIGDQINRLWRQSGSDTTDLLLDRADKAINDKQFDAGLDILDSVIALKPDWAEAWNRRATLHFMREDYDGSMRDIARVLKLEPRHFGALAGMAMIYANLGDMKRAVRVGREALRINPQMSDLKEMIERNKFEAEGNEI